MSGSRSMTNSPRTSRRSNEMVVFRAATGTQGFTVAVTVAAHHVPSTARDSASGRRGVWRRTGTDPQPTQQRREGSACRSRHNAAAPQTAHHVPAGHESVFQGHRSFGASGGQQLRIGGQRPRSRRTARLVATWSMDSRTAPGDQSRLLRQGCRLSPRGSIKIGRDPAASGETVMSPAA